MSTTGFCFLVIFVLTLALTTSSKEIVAGIMSSQKNLELRRAWRELIIPYMPSDTIKFYFFLDESEGAIAEQKQYGDILLFPNTLGSGLAKAFGTKIVYFFHTLYKLSTNSKLFLRIDDDVVLCKHSFLHRCAQIIKKQRPYVYWGHMHHPSKNVSVSSRIDEQFLGFSNYLAEVFYRNVTLPLPPGVDTNFGGTTIGGILGGMNLPLTILNDPMVFFDDLMHSRDTPIPVDPDFCLSYISFHCAKKYEKFTSRSAMHQPGCGEI